MTGMVAVGVSLGGLQAVSRFLKHLPASLRAPVVVVQHRRADAPVGFLANLLQSATDRAVSEPGDKDPVEPGNVYIAPAGYHLLVDEGRFALSTEDPVRWARPSIDVFFESAAAAYGARLTAVVMTGASDDGATGALTVKAAGGRVFVQTPETAESPVAPLATKRVLTPDVEGTLEELAEALGR